ncbi:MAG: helix-turn-helix transcriptional regulator [Candidatus Zixiibacteriota bacterium]
MDFIRKNFHRNNNINEFADGIGCSLIHLSSLFSRHLGHTPRDFLRKVRMKEAKRLIETTCHSVKIVAQKCGYGTEWNFIKTFKKTFGRTPSEHRREFSQI